MLGVQRPGVAIAIEILEGYGPVKATRGMITILDRTGPDVRSDPAYGIPEAECGRLIGGSR